MGRTGALAFPVRASSPERTSPRQIHFHLYGAFELAYLHQGPEFMNTMFAFLNGWEIVAILAIVVILFGAKKLPELARGLGQGIKEFKKSSQDNLDERDTKTVLHGQNKA
jgi:sec-independent protein translocase protein TatA